MVEGGHAGAGSYCIALIAGVGLPMPQPLNSTN
jgi:hypothetical protein